MSKTATVLSINRKPDDRAGLFGLVCSMDEPLERAGCLAHAIGVLAKSMEMLDGPDGTTISLLAFHIGQEIKKAEQQQGFLWRLTHPDRVRFARQGWPSAAKVYGAGAHWQGED